MLDFDYTAPQSLSDAIQLLAVSGSRPLAGGTDLIDHLRTGRQTAAHVVDVKRIPELNRLEISTTGLRIGAAVPCWRILADADIARRWSALADACQIIGGVQIQSRASVGGNLCNSGPAADSIPALVALHANCVIAGPQGQRTVPVETFCTAPGKNVLQPGELLVELLLPVPAAHTGSHYQRFIPRNEMDIAVVGVGASLTLTKGVISAVRISLGAVAPRPLMTTSVAPLLIGQAPSEALFHRAGEAARSEISPIDDMRGTADFRRHITGVLVERALAVAAQRAASA